VSFVRRHWDLLLKKDWAFLIVFPTNVGWKIRNVDTDLMLTKYLIDVNRCWQYQDFTRPLTEKKK
jgi:hypothetical protein